MGSQDFIRDRHAHNYCSSEITEKYISSTEQEKDTSL